MPRPVSKREQILALKKASKKGAIPDICARHRNWEPHPDKLSLIGDSEGLHRTVCKYDEDVPIIVASPSLFELAEQFCLGADGPWVQAEMAKIIIATREMALERWEKKTSGLRSARKMQSYTPPERKKPRHLKPGDLDPTKKVDVVEEITKLKEGLDV